MQILVDADACPVVIRDILYRAAQKRGIKLTLFANQSFQIPASPLISSIRSPRALIWRITKSQRGSWQGTL